MSNQLVLLAQSVVDDASNYPECIVSRATYLVDSYAGHRILIQCLWQWRELFRLYNRTRRAHPSRNYTVRGAAAGNSVRAAIRTNSYAITSNDFHLAKNTLRWGRRNAWELEGFGAAIQALQSLDTATMLRYASCVNAKRYDSTVLPVKFMRWLPPYWLVEILAWRLHLETNKGGTYEQSSTRPFNEP